MPLYFMPLLGSWLADVCGYNKGVLFALALLTMALIAATRLCKPKTRKSSLRSLPCVAPENGAKHEEKGMVFASIGIIHRP